MKKSLIIGSIISLSMLFQFPANAAQELSETNQVVSGFYPLNETSISAASPLRVGNIGSGSEDLVAINSQFNQPRKENGIQRVHAGVDLHSKINSTTGRDVFSVYKNGKVIISSPDIGNGFGEYVVIQHEHLDSSSGKSYYFQSVYAHLASRSLTTTTTYTTPQTAKVGKSGATGLGAGSTAIHLHLEFRTPTNSGIGSYRYAPAVFYWQKGTWGTNTSFINYTGKSGNTVTFNAVSLDNGTAHDVPASRVKIFYKNAASAGAFSSASMVKSGNNFSYTFSGFSAGTTIKFYIEAQENRWDGTLYKAYRPYHDRLSTPPPANKSFELVMQ
ncbi:M23 family metallopeptidase [Paenibacillus sp. GSMTC-2017]|uniref:M23 family metallopeptidase n=1 Tax=Paenibacillus sp. GSMTC-2017 TaxID=2794350 RepID=UPI0018D5B403|nr:M23 family metallopeptidase [Paenibacillus sp. GSMTC-2017]MBH5317619.1 M23 family metallopeptidase [Paenibacillus sp. GSMTC-2017]